MTHNEFKAARLKLGLTQESLANKLEISRVIVGLMERNQAPINRRTELSVLYLLIQLKNTD